MYATFNFLSFKYQINVLSLTGWFVLLKWKLADNWNNLWQNIVCENTVFYQQITLKNGESSLTKVQANLRAL